MYRYPSIREAETHAKHLYRTFNIKWAYAQEIVAYYYNCNEWAELKSKQNRPITPCNESFIGSFDYLSSDTEVEELDKTISPHINAIKKYIKPQIHIAGCLLERIANKQYGRISGQIIRNITETCAEESLTKSSEIIELIEYEDDTFSRILTQKNEVTNCYDAINSHIEPKSYEQKFYAYFKFNKKNLYVLSREWDIELFRPSNSKNKIAEGYLQSVCTRKWFKSYMIGYLKLLTQQFCMAGYSGKIRICTVQNATVSDFYYNKTSQSSNQGTNELFSLLLEMGGKYTWDEGGEGYKHDLGIELSFSATTGMNGWMLGESRL